MFNSDIKRQAEILAVARFGSEHACWWKRPSKTFYGLTPGFMFEIYPEVVLDHLLNRTRDGRDQVF